VWWPAVPGSVESGATKLEKPEEVAQVETLVLEPSDEEGEAMEEEEGEAIS